MDRDKDLILFTKDEQAEFEDEFNIQPEVLVEGALDIADELIYTASRLTISVETPADNSDLHQVAERQRLKDRAEILRTMAAQIMQLCPNEVLARVLENSRIRSV